MGCLKFPLLWIMSMIYGMEITVFVGFFFSILFFLNKWYFSLNYCYSTEVGQGVIQIGPLWYFIGVAEVCS